MVLYVSQARGIFLGGTITEIFKLRFVSAVFVLVICGAEVSVPSACIEVNMLGMHLFYKATFQSN